MAAPAVLVSAATAPAAPAAPAAPLLQLLRLLWLLRLLRLLQLLQLLRLLQLLQLLQLLLKNESSAADAASQASGDSRGSCRTQNEEIIQVSGKRKSKGRVREEPVQRTATIIAPGNAPSEPRGREGKAGGGSGS